MPDVPNTDFIDALSEIWLTLNCAAYHLAYVRVYSQTAALQTDIDHIRKLEQDIRDMSQVDVVVCRAHLAAFFWQLDHVFEALRIAIVRGQKEHSKISYFWSAEKRFKELMEAPISQEINAYRNKAHELPAIIGCKWAEKGGKFLYHFLPVIVGHEHVADIEMNEQLQKYFEFVANVWLSFLPSDLKERFPRNFKFFITIPHSYIGVLPAGLENAPQLEVRIEAQ